MATVQPASAETAHPMETTPAENVVTLCNGGVVKKILREGTGTQTPPDGADVNVHYVGTLLDGTKFDSSRDRNEPFTFKIGKGNVIKGWDEGVATMKKGELALLTCKPEFAYGAAGSPPKIPANATLQFEVELLSWSSLQKVTDDAGVQKEVIRAGEGYDRPNDGAQVHVKLSGRIPDGEVFLAEQELNTTIGEDAKQLEGLDEAYRNMYKGEKSKFFMTPQYGYGATGNASLKVPPNSALEYTIEMLSFQKAKESWEMNNQEKIEHGNKKKNLGNDFFKSGSLEKAVKKYDAVISMFQYDRAFSDAEKKKLTDLKIQCYSNKATCEFKLKRFDEVVKAATEALKLDATHLKSLFHRAQVFAMRNDLDAALRDLEKAQAVDAQNKDVASLTKAVKMKMDAIRKKERQMFGGFFGKVNLVDEKKPAPAAAPAPVEKKDEKEKETAASAAPAAAAEPQAAEKKSEEKMESVPTA